VRLGFLLVQGGGCASWSHQDDQELGTVEQAEGGEDSGSLGARFGKKKHKTSAANMGSRFRVFGF
jgi:hypothetical protein